MTPDPFESGTIAAVLSWLSAAPIFLGMCAGALAAVFAPGSARLKALFAWMLLCALALTPVRYMLFQIVVGTTYPWQSLRAFLSTFILAIYIPIVFGLLCAVGIAIPVLLATLIVGQTEKPRHARVFAAAVVFPVLCVLGSWVYYGFAFPLAARTVYWLNPVDVIRATNGPGFVTFKYIAMPFTPMSFPVSAEELSGSDLDLMRLHVAFAYMNDRNRAWVLKTAYPKLFERLYQRRSGFLSNITFDPPARLPRPPGSVGRAGQRERYRSRVMDDLGEAPPIVKEIACEPSRMARLVGLGVGTQPTSAQADDRSALHRD